MDILEAHNFIRYILQKERGGWVTPEETDDLLYRAGWMFFNKMYDSYAKDQEAKDALSVLSTKFQFSSSTTGLVTLPINPLAKPCYEHLLSLYVQYYDNIAQLPQYKAVKFISEDAIAERLNSQILRPTNTDPVGEQVSPGIFQLYPATTLAGYGYYLRQPVRPQFVYTFGTDGRTIVYNQSASIQMEWNSSSMNKVLMMAIELAGVNLDAEQLVQYAESKNQQDI